MGSTLLFAAALGDPAKESAHAGAFCPHEMQEFAGVEIGGGGAKESFHAPAKIGAFPRRESVAFGDNPVIAKRVQHVLEARHGGQAGDWRLEAGKHQKM